MNNQVLLWALFVVPWITVFFMKREDRKRYMPVALLAAVLGIIIHEIGKSYQWWKVIETAYPLQLLPYLIGLHPVTAMWIFKFTYRKFWLFLVVEVVFNLGFSFLFHGWFLPSRGITELTKGPFAPFIMSMLLGLVLYVYQIWQEGIFAIAYRPESNRKE